jgi:hypothetical protein
MQFTMALTPTISDSCMVGKAAGRGLARGRRSVHCVPTCSGQQRPLSRQRLLHAAIVSYLEQEAVRSVGFGKQGSDVLV